MLSALKDIAHNVAQQPNFKDALSCFVAGIKQAMKTQCCSVYFIDKAQDDFVLMATDGLNPSAEGHFRLNKNDGLVGLVAKREDVINLAMAKSHPDFKHAPQVQEDDFNAFLAVPIIHQGQVIGVIVVQQRPARVFSQDEEAFLVTLSAQLAAQLSHAGAQYLVEHAQSHQQSSSLTGLSGAPGIAIGQAYVVIPSIDFSQIELTKLHQPQHQIRQFHHAVISTRREFKRMAEALDSDLGEESLAVFSVYEQLLDAKSLGDKVEDKIHQGWCAKSALKLVIEDLVAQFMSMQDTYIRERAIDIKDIGLRVLHHLIDGEQARYHFDKPVILVAQTVTTSMLGDIPKDKLAGVISISGAANSHASILTRAMSIPALWGVTDLPLQNAADKMMILDAYNGCLHIAPSQALCDEYRLLQQQESDLNSKFAAEYHKQTITMDGEHISLQANAGLVIGKEGEINHGCEGVGLYRTEAWFMQHKQFPSFGQQVQWYQNVLKAYHPLSVTMRTLDIGGDKALSYFNFEEENPFLGWRGIRISLDHPELFLEQIKAMLVANMGLGNLRIMLPMVADISEVSAAKRLLKQAYHELYGQYADAVSMPPIGVMIEVPSSVYLLPEWAKEVDFCSVGSNDLTQYLLAVDRTNPRVAGLFDTYNPAVLRALNDIAVQCIAYELPFSLCGELAADPEGAILLVAMGYRKLSMSATAIGRVKYVLRRVKASEIERLLVLCLASASAKEVHQHLRQFIIANQLEQLIYSQRHNRTN